MSETRGATSEFLGTSPAAEKVRRLIGRAARVESTVLITGESGVGKELVAREVHARSKRHGNSFVPLNCAAIPDALIEAELFGHEAGAFTDARERRRGAFELADRGTLFLDEVGDLSLSAQPKLLRALESGEILRVGGERIHNTDIRVVAATNHDLKAMCQEGRFRTDLYYRLCVLEIRVPPLRERIEDVPRLANYFARKLAGRTGRSLAAISDEAIADLQGYHWPGNVRELKHVMERAMAMSSAGVLDPDCFEMDPISLPGTMRGLLESDWKNARDGFEATYARNLMLKHEGSVKKAARAAGLAPGSLYKMLRRLGLRPGPKSS